jgi:probable rRNA maturation factor
VPILIKNKQKDLRLSGCNSKIEQIIYSITSSEKIYFHDMGLFFITNAHMCKLHKEFFDDPSPTDCMSFPMDTDSANVVGHTYLGDIFICPRTAVKYAKDHSEDPYTELTLYIIHGVLHLLGYDDIEPRERRKMKAKERLYMQRLAEKNLLLSTPT